MDIEDLMTHKQLGLLSRLMREHVSWLPDEWKDRAGYRPGLADWRLSRFEGWAVSGGLTRKGASAVITALSEENLEGAREILRNYKCPIV